MLPTKLYVTQGSACRKVLYTLVIEICEKILTQMMFGQTGCNINQSTTDPATNTTYCETYINGNSPERGYDAHYGHLNKSFIKNTFSYFCVPFSVIAVKNYMFFVVYMVNFNKVVMNMWNRTV
jgi:hypothetical protein